MPNSAAEEDIGTPLEQGAEAKIYRSTYQGKPAIVKHRFVKHYRHPDLDARITKERIKAESRALTRCEKIGIRAPLLYHVDMNGRKIVMEDMSAAITVHHFINRQLQLSAGAMTQSLLQLASRLGQLLARLHNNQLIHGDLTTCNMLLGCVEELENGQSILCAANISENTDHLHAQIVLIDFGLSHVSGSAEHMAVDLYVLERAIRSTHGDIEEFSECILSAYRSDSKKDVMKKLNEVRMRGRKRDMVG